MRKSFTLIELIVVIAIIAILAAIIAPNAFKAIEKAKIARTISEVKTIKAATVSYYADTGQWPPQYRLTTVINPFLNDPGVSGWDGPYVEKWNAHPWAGMIGWDSGYDADNSGALDCVLVLDDDLQGTNAGNNEGLIPFDTMKKIDAAFDDGDLLTGKVRGRAPNDTTPNGPETFYCANGEMAIMVINDGGAI